MIQDDFSSTTFTLPEDADSLDVVINEVLFNPRPGGVDFVELFNRSDKYINLKNWSIGNFEEDSITNSKVITEKNLLLPPTSYLVLTEDPVILKADYPMSNEARFITTDLPSLPNENGTVSIVNQSNNLIDAFEYDENFHLSLLDNFDGISLERVSAEKQTQSQDNWKSAASTAGFATPGIQNSQQISIQSGAEVITISPRVIVPDNDGMADFATINFNFDSGNNIATVSVFDALGRPVKRLLENASIPANGFITWDGTNDRLQKVRIGSYIIHFEVFDAGGNVSSFKDRIVVGSRF